MVGWKGRLYNNYIAYLLPIKFANKIRYYYLNRTWPDLDQPQRLTEKLSWLTYYNKLYNEKLIQLIYDKHLVRDYVRSKGLDKILTKEFGRYNNAEDIIFDDFPDNYILKSTQSSGQNLIVKKEMNLSREEIIDCVSDWNKESMNKNRFMGYYFTDEKTVICEELLLNEDGKVPHDIRIHCCNGTARWICCDIDTLDEEYRHKDAYYREYFDTEWNFLPVDNLGRTRPNKNKALTEKPERLDEMIKIAETLTQDFVFARVDLYNVKGKIFFGEITPIPGMAGGFEPDVWDYKFGGMVELPDVKIW